MMNRRFNYATIENGIVENLSVGGTDVTAADALTRYENLNVGLGTNTALETTGVDLTHATGGTAVQYYGAFFATQAITATKLYIYLTEAYVKDTADCKIEVYDATAVNPVKIFGTTLATKGVDAGTVIEVDVEKGKGSIAAGMRLDVKITTTGSTSGTGYAIMKIGYTV
jgi:hypothetical protein